MAESEKSYWDKNALKIFGLFLLLFNIISVARIFNGDLLAPKNYAPNAGHTNIYISYVIDWVSQHLNKPFSLKNGTLIYINKNPGFFAAIVEICLRLGITEPHLIVLIPWFLVNWGLVATFFWIKIFFKDNLMALGSIAFLISTPYVPFYGLTLLEPPYGFAFQNISFLFLVLFYERHHSWPYLMAALFFQFLTYQNYWMHHLPTLAVSFAIAHYYEKKFLNKAMFLSLFTVTFAFLFTLWNLMLLKGGVLESLKYLRDLFLWRATNASTESFSKVEYLSLKHFLLYPLLIEKRMVYMFYIPLSLFILWYWGIRKKLPLMVQKSKVFLYLTISLCLWYLTMLQHTAIHAFAGQYAYLILALVIGAIVAGLYKIYLESQNLWQMPLKYSLGYVLPLIGIFGIYGFVIRIVGHTFF